MELMVRIFEFGICYSGIIRKGGDISLMYDDYLELK